MLSLPSSASSISGQKYDVFLNFRGEDTRTNFTSHLHAALKRSGIITFMDDPMFLAGKEIAVEILQAIHGSWCSLVILSENYASSLWCLDELSEIIKQKKERGHQVFPIFYHVNPSDFRKQRGRVGEAFAEHEKRYMEHKDRVERWRTALTEVTNIAGWLLFNGEDESKIIENIVTHVSTKLCETYPAAVNLLLQDAGESSSPHSSAIATMSWQNRSQLESNHPNAKSLIEPDITHGASAKSTTLPPMAINNSDEKSMRIEEKSGLRKSELFQQRFYDLIELSSYAQALHAEKIVPLQYHIYVGHQPAADDESYNESEKFIGLNGCDICKDGVKILSDVEVLNIVDCNVDLCEEEEEEEENEAFFSRFIPVPLNIFSSLSQIQIISCQNIKKLFSFDWESHIKNLVKLHVEDCNYMEEIIALESELEEEISVLKFILPKLRLLVLRGLPQLKSICGANGVMVCDSIQEIEIVGCPKLKRIPLNLPLQDDGQPSSLKVISISSEEWWETVEWDHPNAKSLLEPYIVHVTEQKGGWNKMELFQHWFHDLNEFNSYAQALHAQNRPPQYRIYIGHQPAADDEISYNESEKFIEFNDCKIRTDGIMILSDVEKLRIFNCTVDLCQEEEAFFLRFTTMPHNFFSTLSRIEIISCKNTKKLFSANCVFQNLQNLDILCVRGCKEMEEIIASESAMEVEEEIGTIVFTLPKLSWLELCDLQALKSICSASGVIVCDSIEKIFIRNCPNLKRMPLNLPLHDDGQPSPPPFLRTINAYPEEWWEVVEWDHPNAKSLLDPYIENWPIL